MSATLYERLGGREAIGAVVDEFYDRVLSDDRINHFFEETDVTSTERRLDREPRPGDGPADRPARGGFGRHYRTTSVVPSQSIPVIPS